MRPSSGVIIAVESYEDCIDFYGRRVGLPVLMKKEGITRFRLGAMYLQVEDSTVQGIEKTAGVILRRNVRNVAKMASILRRRGVDLQVHDLDWGSIGFVLDPSGNKLEYFRER
jgi:hypothetical protein